MFGSWSAWSKALTPQDYGRIQGSSFRENRSENKIKFDFLISILI
jgi:hypothetical protein